MAEGVSKRKLDRSQPIFLGMDVHKHSWSMSFVHCGELIHRCTIAADMDLLRALLKKYDGFRIKSVYEAGCFGFHLHYQLVDLGVENIIVAVHKMPTINGDRVKTDRKDSFKLAQFLSQGLLKAIYVPPREQLAVRQLVRTRVQLIRKQAATITQLKHLLLVNGIKMEEGKLTKRQMQEIRRMILPEAIKTSAEMYLSLIEQLRTQVDHLEQEAENIATDPSYRDQYFLLSTVPGMGPLTARALLFEVGDWSRFPNEKTIAAYFGLTPSEYSSGDRVCRGRITGQGKEWLRAMLIQVAWASVKKDQEVAQLFSRLTKNTGSKKKAIVAVARHLLCRIRAMMINNQIYHHQSELSA